MALRRCTTLWRRALALATHLAACNLFSSKLLSFSTRSLLPSVLWGCSVILPAQPIRPDGIGPSRDGYRGPPGVKAGHLLQPTVMASRAARSKEWKSSLPGATSSRHLRVTDDRLRCGKGGARHMQAPTPAGRNMHPDDTDHARFDALSENPSGVRSTAYLRKHPGAFVAAKEGVAERLDG